MKAIVVFEESIREPGTLYLQPGINVTIGERVFTQTFGTPTSLEKDLLVLVSAIFACDLAFKRGQRENVPRKIELTPYFCANRGCFHYLLT